MTRFALLILILSLLLTGSCSSRKNRIDHSNLIPQNQLVSILTDVYITDGLLALPVVNLWLENPDTLSTYYKVIEEHGYSKEVMDKTMKYYFIKNPGKLIKIYDQVLAILHERESYLEKELVLEALRERNLWRDKEIYAFPDPSGADSACFSISLPKQGIYNLTFTSIVFPDDQSLNPRFTAYLCNADSIDSGKRTYIESLYYFKDAHLHQYTLSIDVPANSNLILKGNFLNYDNYCADCSRHATISDFILLFIP